MECERASGASDVVTASLCTRRRTPLDHAHERLAERRHEWPCDLIKSGRDQLDRIACATAQRALSRCGTLHRPAALARCGHISRIQPSAIIAANPYALMYASLAMRLSRRRAPLVVTFHSTRLLGLKEQLQMAAYRPLFWGADCAVFVCEKQRRYWRRRGVFSRRNEVIYNGVDTDEFSDARDSRAGGRMRAARGLRDADYVIGIAAVLRPEKITAAGGRHCVARAGAIPAKHDHRDGPCGRPSKPARARRTVASDVVIKRLSGTMFRRMSPPATSFPVQLHRGLLPGGARSDGLGQAVVHARRRAAPPR